LSVQRTGARGAAPLEEGYFMHAGRRRSPPALAALAATCLSAVPALAGDGKLEINHRCALVGCFAGDTAGYPVQVNQATEPRSYLLTGNLEPGVGQNGILVSVVQNVTIDLNGFAVVGPDTGSGSGIIIDLGSGASFVEVRNGSVVNFGAAGITTSGGGRGIRLVDLRVSGNNADGIDVAGEDFRIENSIVTLNGGDGISVSAGATIVGCTVSANGGDGIVTGQRALIQSNVVRSNGNDGIDANSGSTIAENVVSENQAHGINLAGSSLVRGNTATSNNVSASGFQNIEACADCTVVDNEN
jgi:hypothetical protein